jgi:hypothetical protein
MRSCFIRLLVTWQFPRSVEIRLYVGCPIVDHSGRD